MCRICGPLCWCVAEEGTTEGRQRAARAEGWWPHRRGRGARHSGLECTLLPIARKHRCRDRAGSDAPRQFLLSALLAATGLAHGIYPQLEIDVSARTRYRIEPLNTVQVMIMNAVACIVC